jgi:nicotinate-nucleotide pyrophosphorylase (carboxylating)
MVKVADLNRWIEEDLRDVDLTSEALIAPDAPCEGVVFLKERAIVCGTDVCAAVWSRLDSQIEVVALAEESEERAAGGVLYLKGNARAILAGERVALNILGRMCGIATLTRRFVDEVAGTHAGILDTRKTAPGLRSHDKRAVRAGGGRNHRFGLHDGILIKDNHLRLCSDLERGVAVARRYGLAIVVECETAEDVDRALAAGADRLLLDNMSPDDLRRVVSRVDGRVELEASGSITIKNAREIAETGVDFISIGSLTHSVKSTDVSLEVFA